MNESKQAVTKLTINKIPNHHFFKHTNCKKHQGITEGEGVVVIRDTIQVDEQSSSSLIWIYEQNVESIREKEKRKRKRKKTYD